MGRLRRHQFIPKVRGRVRRHLFTQKVVSLLETDEYTKTGEYFYIRLSHI